MPGTAINISRSFSTAESLLSRNNSRQDESFSQLEKTAQKQHKSSTRNTLCRTVSETSLEKYREERAVKEALGIKDLLFTDIQEKTGELNETKRQQQNMEKTEVKDQEEIESTESDEVKNEQEQQDSEGSWSSKDDKQDDEMMIKMNKPWPPLMAEFTGKPRSYSDTSPRREIIKATKGDIRSCTSYMHLPHISALKPLSHLRDAASSPHLHQSFSRMHLPHTIDPDDDFPTVSVIALADARDRDGDDEAISDNDIRDIYCPANNIEDLEDSDASVQEEAIYTWDREFGRTRSLSEPTDLNSLFEMTEGLDQRPRAMSLESANKAKKPPSRIQFQMTLGELSEEHNDETETESVNYDTDIDNLANSSVLVLAESREFETDSDHTEEARVKESDSQDEVLTRWTRYENHPHKKPSFCAELSTIDENIIEGTTRLPTRIPSKTASVLALVDEVAQEVMSNESLINESLAVQTCSDSVGGEADTHDDSLWKNKISPRMILRRTTLATASPPREPQSYATDIERQAFNKISQWKTDFVVKLEDVLNKGIDRKTDDKETQQKSIVVNVPMDLTNDELKNLKGDMLAELRRTSDNDEVKKSLLSQLMISADDNLSLTKETKEQVEQEIKRDDKELVSSQLLKDTCDSDLSNDLSNETYQNRPSSPENLDRIVISKDKITELLHWHDQERESLLLEMKNMQVASESLGTTSSSNQFVFDSTDLERVFSSLRVIIDSIFKETILRLRGTLESDVLKPMRSYKEEEKIDRNEQQRKEEEEVSMTTGIEGTDVEHVKLGGTDIEKEHLKIMKIAAKSTQYTATIQPSTKTEVLEKQSQMAKQKTQLSRIPVPVRKITEVPSTTPRQVKTSSAQEKARSTSAAHKTISIKSSLPIYVHTTSFGEHICHRETCAGMADDSSPTCECDSASDEMDTTDLDQDEYTDETTCISGTDLGEYYEFSDYQVKRLRGRPEVFPGGSSTNETADITPSSSTSIPQQQSTSATVMTSREPSSTDNEKWDKEKYDGFYSEEEENDEELNFEESDACSEIADLLGVYQVYNAVKDHDNELPRPHAPELMTYEEKDIKDKLKKQKVRLKGYKRMVRSFKSRNKRLKEERRHLRRQIQEWHDRCVKKEARVSELKQEIDSVSSTAENYRRSLEDKSDIIKMKDKQISKLLRSDVQEHESRDGQEQDNVGKTTKESSLKYELESKKTIIRDKEKVIQELVSQHEKTVQELMKKTYEVMRERDELKEDNSRLKVLSSGTEESERKKRNLEAQVSSLEKAVKEADIKSKEKEKVYEDIVSSLVKKLHEHNEKHHEDSRLLIETQRSYEQLKTSSSSAMAEQEKEIASLKASVEAFQSLVQGLTEERNDAIQKHDVTRSADHSFMKEALKEAVCAKEDEIKRHQQTQVKLQDANQRLSNVNSMVDRKTAGKENVIAKMKKQQQALQDENNKLKRQLKEKKESSSILIEFTELQAKLAQRDCEIKELRQEALTQQEETRKILKQSTKQSSSSKTFNWDKDFHRSLENKDSKQAHDSDDGKSLSLAQGCEEEEFQQQELDKLRGRPSAATQPSTGSDDILRLRKDIAEIKSAFEDFLKTQSEYRTIAQDELKDKLEYKTKEMEKQESFYRQIVETKNNAYAEVVKEKNTITQILNESIKLSQKGQSKIDMEVIIKDAIEKGVNQRIDELRKSIEMISKQPPESEVLHDVISDLLKMNQKAVERLKDCSEQAWANVKEDVDVLKDCTFNMTDVMEKHFYSSHENFSDIMNSSIEEVIKYVKNESNVVRESFLEGMQAHYELLADAIQKREGAEIGRYENLQASIDGYNRRNVREFHQARRDVLLAAEAVSNTAEEFHQIKNKFLLEISSKDIVDKEEYLRHGKMIKKGNEYKEMRKTAGKTLQNMDHEYPDQADIFETNPMLKERQLKGTQATRNTAGYSRDDTSLNTTAELANQEDTRFREALISNMKRVSSTGELGRTVQEEELRRNYQTLYHTPPSRDSEGFSQRERLQQRARSRGTGTDGVSHSDDPYNTRTAIFWSRDTPSS